MIYRFPLLSPDEVRRINETYNNNTHWKTGKVQINQEHIHDDSVKSSRWIDKHSSSYNYIVEIIHKALQNQLLVKSAYVLKDITQPQLTEYLTGGHYQRHIDSVYMDELRTDHSLTLFLNDPDEYEGGELNLYHGDEKITIKERAGTAVLYNTGMLHEVNEVTSGSRRVALMWATSLIDDPLLREHIIDLGSNLHQFVEYIDYNLPEHEKTLKQFILPLEQVRTNMVRAYGNFK